MKKTIFLVAMLQWIFISPAFSMNNTVPPVVKEIKTGAFTSVIINADVKVELLNSGDRSVRLSGNDFFLENITVTQKGNSLVIDAVKSRNYKSKGVVYIPASAIKSMQVNSAAHIQSATMLAIPRLDILINGACKIDIANKGELNLAGTERYDVDYVMRDARFPFAILDASGE